MNKGTKISNAKNKIEEFLNTNEKSLAEFYLALKLPMHFRMIGEMTLRIFCFTQ